jgi:N-methylhydantoinase B/oxoprolinase/acetone carboxylase alpha subunit
MARGIFGCAGGEPCPIPFSPTLPSPARGGGKGGGAGRRPTPRASRLVKNALYSTAEEMKIVLAKTAYSPLLKVAGDYSCGIFDGAGDMVAQGPDLPIHLGSMPDAARAVIATFPEVEPGDVFIRFTDVFDGDGVVAPGAEADEPFTVRMSVRKSGDSISADFTGSDGQVPGPMNAPLTVTASGVYCALKMIADPHSLIPPNSGCWRPVTVTAPPGSVVNAQMPARLSTPITRSHIASPTWSWRQCFRSALKT